MTNRALYALLPLALLTAGCSASKSSTPLSPTVAGPLPGVNISAPKPLEPVSAQVPVDKQPVTLLIENASSNGPRPLSYDFEVATDLTFANKVFTRSSVDAGPDGRTQLRLSDALATGYAYYWRARAEDGANVSPYSEVVRFNVYSAVVIAAPALTSPAYGATTSNLHPQLAWSNAQRTGPAGRIAYVVEVSETNSFANKLEWGVDELPGTTTFNLPGDLPATRLFFWHVRAYDPTNSGPWSNTNIFSTPAAPVVAPPPSGGGGSGAACNPKPTTGPAIIACVESKYPDKLVAGVSDSQRVANMEFLRNKVIETGICSGMDIGWNLKRGGPEISVDAIVWRHGFDDIIDIGFAYDDTSRPLALQWISVTGAFYQAYTPRPTCP
jgi:hypothetical protein